MEEEIIETIVPISIDNLKKYFENKNIKFLIDYDESKIKDEKFLLYISNLDIPCDIKFDKTNKSHLELIKLYMNSKSLINLPVIEEEVLEICLEASGFGLDDSRKEFIEENYEIINVWLDILKSLSLYNFYTLKEHDTLKEEYILQHEKRSSDGLGINFVNLLKYEDCCLLFMRDTFSSEKLYYYEDIFNEYMFNGKNLFHYWQNENNRLYMLTWAITSGTWRRMAEEGKIKNFPEMVTKNGETNVTPV
jgi:arsenate reductase-like glutaredoxin family protein